LGPELIFNSILNAQVAPWADVNFVSGSNVLKNTMYPLHVIIRENRH